MFHLFHISCSLLPPYLALCGRLVTAGEAGVRTNGCLARSSGTCMRLERKLFASSGKGHTVCMSCGTCARNQGRCPWERFHARDIQSHELSCEGGGRGRQEEICFRRIRAIAAGTAPQIPCRGPPSRLANWQSLMQEAAAKAARGPCTLET